jgi:hypothetical protein
MISFACKQCGTPFERPEEARGTLVFCGCGTGTRVPWESTLPPLARPVEEPPRVDRPLPRWGELPYESEPRLTGPRDRNFCLNHQSAPATQACSACNETFCAGCMVPFQGGTWCGPCKNYRVRGVQRPASLSVMAIMAPLLALGAGVLWIFGLFVVAGASLRPDGAALAGTAIVGLFPQGIAFVLGALALRKIESETKTSGRDLAITGMVAAGVCACLILLIMVLLIQQVAG